MKQKLNSQKNKGNRIPRIFNCDFILISIKVKLSYFILKILKSSEQKHLGKKSTEGAPVPYVESKSACCKTFQFCKNQILWGI